ncbi:MAG: hypothetical protein ACP5MZ_04055 [Candidatus Micrarchaeia archaeon]
MENKTKENSKYIPISKAIEFRLDDFGGDSRLDAELKNAIAIGLHMLRNAEVGSVDGREIVIKAVSDEFYLADEKLVSQVRSIFAEVIDPIMLELHNLEIRRMKRVDFEMNFIISDYIRPCAARINDIMEKGEVSGDVNIKNGVVYPVIIMPIVKGLYINLKFYSALVDEMVRLEDDEESKALIKALAFKR